MKIVYFSNRCSLSYAIDKPLFGFVICSFLLVTLLYSIAQFNKIKHFHRHHNFRQENEIILLVCKISEVIRSDLLPAIFSLDRFKYFYRL